MPEMTEREIVQETILHYDFNPRDTEFGCRYKSESGTCCGVGRCMAEDGHEFVDNMASEVVDINEVGVHDSWLNSTSVHGLVDVLEAKTGERSIDPLLKPKYRGHSVGFWMMIQGLHDNDDHWSEDGITNAGLAYANSIVAEPWRKDQKENLLQ